MTDIIANATDVVATTAAAVVKAPSKRSQALVIFNEKIAERDQGLFATNKDFRTTTIQKICADLGVSVASSSTMFNSFKKMVEAAGTLTAPLGRDPKKEKPVSTGKKGRPSGSKNAVKNETTDTEAVATETTEAVAEAAPAV